MKDYLSIIPRLCDSVIFKIILISFGLSLLSFLLQGNIGIDLSSEGFLFYGVTQTALGEVPIQDFMSYDPGRYYWCAFWSKLFGPGILSLRLSSTLFQVLGLSFGLLTLHRVIRSWWLLFFAGLVLLIWMHPRHKFFEPSIIMAAMFFAVRLIEKHSFKRHFVAGIFVGLAAFFGRNLGLYCFVSFFLLIVFYWCKFGKEHLWFRLWYWGLGIVVGYSPMILMFFLYPGVFANVFEMISTIVRLGGTNMPVPVPWPWAVNYSQMDFMNIIQAFIAGSMYVFLPLFFLVMLINIMVSGQDQLKRKTVIVAVSFVGLIYMHYPFSCGDFPHLTQSVHPFLIGMLSVPFVFNFNRILKTGHFLVVFLMTLIIGGFVQPLCQKAIAQEEQNLFVPYTIAGDNLLIRKYNAGIIDAVKQIHADHVEVDEALLLVPQCAGLYPILQREAPLWNLFYIFPETDINQKEMIDELASKNVNWIISADVFFGGLKELHLQNTHSLLWQHIKDEFEVSTVPHALPSNFQLWHRKRK